LTNPDQSGTDIAIHLDSRILGTARVRQQEIDTQNKVLKGLGFVEH
jgi:hypothetical protein